jgi:predicted house-cleaning noncanonical NTP pyrophosphatase (MazG superfamily)
MVYSVADLVRPITKTKVTPSDAGAAEISPEPFRAPASTKQDLADYSSLVELIKASVEPESWNTGPGAATIAENRDVLGLVIRQSKEAHEAIAKLLSQLRKSQDSVQITCRLLKIATNAQLKGLEEKCSLHSLSDGQRWALLTKSRNEELQKFLTDENTEVLSCPKIVTISGQAAFIEVGSEEQSKLQGFRLSANPRLIADSSVIRLSHSVTVGELAKDAQAAVHESLVGSGQTLLLVIEQPGKVDGHPDRFVVMLTPEHVKEEEETLPR